jgi:hypothetical protein
VHSTLSLWETKNAQTASFMVVNTMDIFCVGYPSNLNFKLSFMNVYLLQWNCKLKETEVTEQGKNLASFMRYQTNPFKLVNASILVNEKINK